MLAALAAVPLTALSTFAGLLIWDATDLRSLGIALAIAVPTAVVWAIWRAERRRNPDVAKGVLIGLCLTVIWAGSCGLMFVGPLK